MIKRKLWIFGFVVTSIAIVVGATSAYFVSEQDKGADKDEPVLVFENLRRQYASVRSVYLVAEAKIAVYGKHFAVGRGTFEYWAEGNRYRIRCRSDKQLRLNSDVDIAYNGELFQFFDLPARVLSVRSTDEVPSHAALQNPFFLPVDFLSSSGDDCPLCRLRFVDLKSHNERWESRAKAARVISKRYDRTNGLITDVEMPGNTISKTPSKLRIKTQGASEDKSLPLQIDKVDLEGRVRASISFKKFIEDNAFQLPSEITITVFDEQGNLTFKLDYKVTTLQINQPLEDSNFTIPISEAEAVWDSDARKFIKEKRR